MDTFLIFFLSQEISPGHYFYLFIYFCDVEKFLTIIQNRLNKEECTIMKQCLILMHFQNLFLNKEAFSFQ